MSAPPVVLVADPPWQLRDALPGAGRGAAKHYPCLSLEALEAFALPPPVVTASDAVLFLWRLSSMPLEAIKLALSWGFRPHSELIWQKLTPTGKAHFGMGRIVRGAHEPCLVCVRGGALPAVRDVRSVFAAPVGVHSEKPERFFALVERMYPDSPRYELFARRTRPGWVQVGNELGLLDPDNANANQRCSAPSIRRTIPRVDTQSVLPANTNGVEPPRSEPPPAIVLESMKTHRKRRGAATTSATKAAPAARTKTKKKRASGPAPARSSARTKRDAHPGGRPERVPGGSRAGQLAVGFSVEERADLDAKAASLGVTSSEVVRMALRALGWIRTGTEPSAA